MNRWRVSFPYVFINRYRDNELYRVLFCRNLKDPVFFFFKRLPLFLSLFSCSTTKEILSGFHWSNEMTQKSSNKCLAKEFEFFK